MMKQTAAITLYIIISLLLTLDALPEQPLDVPTQVVGLAYDTGYEASFIATASLTSPKFSPRTILDYQPYCGVKHPKNSTYYAITSPATKESTREFYLFAVDIATWKQSYNVTLKCPFNTTRGLIIDSLKYDSVSNTLLAVIPLPETSAALAISINPVTGNVTVLCHLTGVSYYFATSTTVDEDSRELLFLVRRANAVQLARVKLPDHPTLTRNGESPAQYVQLKGHKLLNKYINHLHYHSQHNKLYGFSTIFDDKLAPRQTLFTIDVASGQISIVLQLDAHWSCEVLSFTMDEPSGTFVVELDVYQKGKTCFADRVETIQVISFDGTVLRNVKYTSLPLDFSSYAAM